MSELSNLVQMLKKDKQTGSDYTGTVTRVEGNTAYVRLTGAEIADTPVARTIDCKAGDLVRVRVANGKAWITGNDTAPPTYDAEVIEEIQKDAKAEKKQNSIRFDELGSRPSAPDLADIHHGSTQSSTGFEMYLSKGEWYCAIAENSSTSAAGTAKVSISSDRTNWTLVAQAYGVGTGIVAITPWTYIPDGYYVKLEATSNYRTQFKYAFSV